MAAPDLQYNDAYWETLVEVYKEQLRENPRSYAYVPLADALVYLGRINEAIEALSWGLTHLPESRAAKVMLAQLLYDIGDLAGSRLLLEDVVAQWPDDLEAASLLCVIYESEGDWESARVLALSLLEFYPLSIPARKMVEYYSSAEGPRGKVAPTAMPSTGETAPSSSMRYDVSEREQEPAEEPQEKQNALGVLEMMLQNIGNIKAEEEKENG
ncbi:MAG: tetratricopeptide repeat protein [Nitrospinota bacterium]|nr:tetratricopeptide repeat protein [Nitrospinota bacterium]